VNPEARVVNIGSTSKTGLFALRGGLLRVTGSGAPSRRLVLSLPATILVALACTAAPALAAAPEAPVVTVEGSTAVVSAPSTEAVFHGVLDPGLVGEPGTYELGEYQFLYKTGATCTGGSVIPASPGMSLGGGHEELPAETVTGLTVSTKYTVCLQMKTAGGTTLSAPVSFKTALSPEKPETISPAKSITATTATFEGTLNPTKAGEAGSYEFLYRVSATECEGERAAPTEPAGVMSGAVKQAVSAPVTALQPNVTYSFCLLARNSAGETSVGQAVQFTTPPAPPTIESEATSSVKATEARLEGVVNPNNQVTECKFQYGTEPLLATGTTTASCEPASFPASFGGQGVGLNVSGLTQDTTYYYRVLATNEAGTAPATIEHFATALPPAAPEKAKATGVTATTATLHGILDPMAARAKEPGSDEFRYRQSASECEGENEKAIGATTAPGLLEKEPAQATVTELLPGSTYTFCLLVRNEAGEETLGQPETFTTLAAAPVVEESSVSDVASTTATLQAKIDPEGSETTYHFEYGTSATYASSIPVPDGLVGSGSTGLTVTAHPQGLLPNTEYHYRVLALSASRSETIPGADGTFTTQGVGGPLALPDGRQWELVSPPANGAEILPIQTFSTGTRAAAAGDAMAYDATAPTEAEPAGNSNLTQVLSARGPDGWRSRDLSIPHSTGTQRALSVEEYRVLSNDLSLSVVQPLGPFNPALSDEASEQTPYLRTDYLHGEPDDFCTSSCYTPLVTGAEGFANVTAGTKFGRNVNEYEGGECPPNTLCGPQIIAATPDLSHVVLFYPLAALVPGGTEFYEWSGGQLQPVPGVGQPIEIGGERATPADVTNAISADGSRIYFSGGVRENIGTPQARTVPVPGGEFETASVNGSRAFVLGGEVLSEFDIETEASVPLAGGVLGVVGASEDGSSVYFVSSEALTGEEENARGGRAVAGSPNLYVDHAGSTAFIAMLSNEDSPDWERGGTFSLKTTSRVSPDGRWIAFMSQRSLTGYDNRDAVSGASDEEVYLYHAPAKGGPGGSLTCASCNPTGARPHGSEFRTLEFATGGLAGKRVWNESQWLAASVPEWTSVFHQARYLSNEGRLFFDSSDALVPQDVNGTSDVYEYEPPGVGSCTGGGPTFVPSSGGCVGLISSGASPEESAFMDASENGDDVFFLSSARLAPQSEGGASVYDAHMCTDSSPCPPPPPPPPPACEGDACQSPAAAFEDPTPGSLTYSGPGNPVLAAPFAKPKPKAKAKRCAKGFVKKRGRCVKSGARRSKVKRAVNKRRAGR
jgi:hypothetical protein